MKGTNVIIVAMIGMVLCVPFALSTTYDIYPTTTNWLSILNSLVAGDIATFHSGTYNPLGSGYTALNLLGTSTNPIIIQGAPGETPKPLIKQLQNQNVLNIVSGHDFIIQGLAFTGPSEGVRLGAPSGSPMYNVVFKNNVIANTTGAGFTANFASQEYYNISIVHNEIFNTGVSTGECFYLGCSDDGCRIHDSLIFNNLCHDTKLASGGSQGSGFQVKHGSYNNKIQDNVCWNLGGPCVLLYGDLGRGRNTAVGNTVISTLDNGIQATAGANIYNNLVFNVKGDGIAIVQNPGGATISNVAIVHNTVLDAQGAGMRLTSFTSTGNFLVANNAVYGPSSSKGAIFATVAQTGVPYYRNGYLGGSPPTGVASPAGMYLLGSATTDLVNPAGYNVYPKSSSTALIGQGNGAYSLTYDFNYRPRSASAPTVGAYEYSTTANPGWVVAGNTFKTNTTAPTTTATASKSKSKSISATRSRSRSRTASPSKPAVGRRDEPVESPLITMRKF